MQKKSRITSVLLLCLTMIMAWQYPACAMARSENFLFKQNLYRLSSYNKQTFEDICHQEKLTINNEHSGYTPLALAISTINSDAVALLIKYGANVNQPFGTESKKTPLIYAIRLGLPEIVRTLLANGANPRLATADYHPLFATLCHHFFKEVHFSIFALLFPREISPLSISHNNMTLYEHIEKGIETMKSFAQTAPHLQESAAPDTTIALYRKAGRALFRYQCIAEYFIRHFSISLEIAEHILTFVDFGLDDYHAQLAKCAICYDKKRFRAIPCSKNTHPDSICSDCIGKLTDCPLCREPFTHQ